MDGSDDRALVLGGGGITGIAWELGILKGLADLGIDLTAADRVIGTSAGSVVGAQITTGLTVDELYAEQLRPADREIGARMTRSMVLRLAVPIVIPAHPVRKRSRSARWRCERTPRVERSGSRSSAAG